jgi:hypothetical protein
MHFDANLLQIFIYNFSEAYRSGALLTRSYPRVKKLISKDTNFLKDMDLDALDKLDAFRVRFCDLQVVLGNKVFRSLLTLEMEPNGSNLDLLNRIDKRGLLPSFELWQEIRNIRNLFIHDYPETEDFRCQILAKALELTPDLINVINRILKYAEEIVHIDVHQYQPLKINP